MPTPLYFRYEQWSIKLPKYSNCNYYHNNYVKKKRPCSTLYPLRSCGEQVYSQLKVGFIAVVLQAHHYTVTTTSNRRERERESVCVCVWWFTNAAWCTCFASLKHLPQNCRTTQDLQNYGHLLFPGFWSLWSQKYLYVCFFFLNCQSQRCLPICVSIFQACL